MLFSNTVRSLINRNAVGTLPTRGTWLISRRNLSITSPVLESQAASTTSKSTVTLPPTTKIPEISVRPASIEYKGMLEQVRKEGIRRANQDNRAEMFLRRPVDRQRAVQPGDIVMVETLNSKTSNTTSTFVGLCIGIFRRGIDTSFTLRNIVMKVGVEMSFKVYSPMVKNIKILEKSRGYHRAKLYYMRKQPEKAPFFNQRKTKAEKMASSS
ncbi:hypothetical protein IWQ62_005514 [Dispira parvispora]|uniref:Ribosomal protein L19 n=1 Tax=Dispira parvispora TaxID=1520584 RepID=A0A9W8AM39_9FUNG|nr:hypothetical protein IWQ62_005514 [Dispira parvispora]